MVVGWSSINQTKNQGETEIAEIAGRNSFFGEDKAQVIRDQEKLR